MKIVIDGVPPSLNQFAGRENTWAYRQEKTRWTRLVWYRAMEQKKGTPTPHFARVKITYYFRDKRRHDPDNYAGKFLLDGLTKAKVIMDDDFAHIELLTAGGVDKEHPRTEIEITEVNHDQKARGY